jgi:hypothetical protein
VASGPGRFGSGAVDASLPLPERLRAIMDVLTVVYEEYGASQGVKRARSCTRALNGRRVHRRQYSPRGTREELELSATSEGLTVVANCQYECMQRREGFSVVTPWGLEGVEAGLLGGMKGGECRCSEGGN